MQKNKNENIFDYMWRLSGAEYISDFKENYFKARLKQTIKETPPEAFEPQEWLKLAEYLQMDEFIAEISIESDAIRRVILEIILDVK